MKLIAIDWNHSFEDEFACFLRDVRTETRQCRYNPVQPDRFLLYADKIVSGVSGQTSCQSACDSERHFRCRSYSLHSPTSQVVTTTVPSSSSGPITHCSLSSSPSPTFEVMTDRSVVICAIQLNLRFRLHFIVQFQRGAVSGERDCSSLITNEIPLQLETAHLGSNDRRVMTSGTASGNVPAADPGGWVSLASLSRSQQVAGHRKTYPSDYSRPGSDTYRPGSDAFRPGSDSFRPGSDSFRPGSDTYRPGSDAFRPGSDSFRPGSDNRPGMVTYRPPGESFRPPADVFRRPSEFTTFDTGYQYNTVGVSSRPFFPSKVSSRSICWALLIVFASIKIYCYS